VADGIGNIGLFAVAEAERGRGHGSRLLDAALAWFATYDLERVNVVTQGRNAAAQRIYQRAGFLTVDTRHWYHFWSADADVSS
jgi:ribosomal protein S18 acetylase RimI-like enzyme